MIIEVINNPFIVIYNSSLFTFGNNQNQGFMASRLYTYKQMSTR